MGTIKINKIEDLNTLSKGDLVSKSEKNSLFTGPEVNNTPQKGINWIGEYPKIDQIILTSKTDSGYHDRWMDKNETLYLYYLMINHRNTHKASIEDQRKENLILIEHSKNKAPILLFINEGKSSKMLEVGGWFEVLKLEHDNKIHHSFVDSVILREL